MTDESPFGLEAARLLDVVAEAGTPGVVHVTSGEQRAEDIARFLSAVAPEICVEVFPPWDCLPYDRAQPSREAMGRRMAVLRRLASRDRPPRIVVTTPGAVLQRLPPSSAVRAFEVHVDASLDQEALRAFCRGAGYVIDERVDEPGEVAFRGEVIDLFPGASRSPYRLEVEDARVTAIRCYDPITQRSIGEVATLVIDAVSELPENDHPDEDRPRDAEHWTEAYPQLEMLLDHMPGARLVTTAAAESARSAALAQIAEAYSDRTRNQAEADRFRHVLPPERLYLTEEEWQQRAAEVGIAVLDAEPLKAVPVFAAVSRPRHALAQFLRAQIGDGRRVLLTAASERDLEKLARRIRQAVERTPERVASWDAALKAEPGAVLAMEASLDAGFVDADRALAVVTAQDLLGSRAESGREDQAAVAPWQIEVSEFHLGDVVVHSDQGVGSLDGLETVESEALGGEAVRLTYAREQSLLVPVGEAAKLWRYGSAEGGVSLDRLDTDAWSKRRAKIGEALAETARALITAAAERDARKADKLVPPQRPYERFVARFPFTETPDQRRAIEAVLGDLASGKPMNRLVVGDVGFGKTEVALRAAAAAAFAGKQVAVVAPTTVLARQHYNTFSRRFAELGVEIAHLSRLIGPKEAQRVRAGLAEGSLRVVIGTHALLGKAVAFAELGLIVIDEEQRFGAEHKRKLRELGRDVHVLTMTATPIPRTLQSALVGLQDLSTIATPPSRRRAIRTLTAEYDPATVRQALLRERRRGGQSFVVVPRVEDIGPVAERLKALVPRLDLRVAHGQMPAREIDETMIGFAEGRGDVLLATSIIESGLDVPTANTMIVMRPDLFGLAQLHQLRGRVGRSHLQAFCYLVSEAREELSAATLKRLGTLQAFDRLGAGMAISAQDLDLRGGGELFGERQAGHVKLIGIALYQELLAAALRAARGEPADERQVEFQTEAGGSLPADYVPEPEMRINIYHRLARTAEPGDVDHLAEEIADRFGPPPGPVRELLAAASIRALAASLGVTRINAGPEAVALSFAPGVSVETDYADALERLSGILEWTGERMLYRKRSETPEERSQLVLELLEELA